MNALILAAGHGTRLRPLTFHQAKASLPLLRVPFIHYPLQYLYLHQINKAVINLHAHAESVRKAAGSDYRGIPIAYSHEEQILGTAGAIRKALPLLGDEPFVVMNGDMLTYIPLSEAIEQHTRLGSDVTMLIMRAEPFASYGTLFFETSDSEAPRLCLSPSQRAEKFHYTGLQIVNPEMAERIPADQKSDILRDIYFSCWQERKIHGLIYDGFWMEIGNLAEYLQTNLDLLQQPLPVALQPPGVEATLVSEEAIIEEDTRIQDSIIMEKAVIKKGSSLDRCIVGSETTVNGHYKKVALSRGILPWYFHTHDSRM